jgi:hypothetical protein
METAAPQLCSHHQGAGWLQMMEANPEMARMMNDPEMIRDAMRMAANPVQSADALPVSHGSLSPTEKWHTSTTDH